MTKYIDREALCDFALNTADKSITPNDIMRFPTEDVISIEVYRQVMWERDTALNQLAEIGKSLGEKMDNIKPVVSSKWEDVDVIDISGRIGFDTVASMFCPVCKRYHNEVYHYGNPVEMAHFCSNCGADMRKKAENV